MVSYVSVTLFSNSVARVSLSSPDFAANSPDLKQWCIAAEEGLRNKYGIPALSVLELFNRDDCDYFKPGKSVEIVSLFRSTETSVAIDIRKTSTGLISANIIYSDRKLSDLKSAEEKRELTKHDFNAL